MVLQGSGAAVVVPETGCSGKLLFDTAREILADTERTKSMRQAASSLAVVDSAQRIYETALELIKRGHRLVADDAVEIKRINRTTLMGSAPEMIRYYMELRGIGVIDARQIYGVGAVKPETRVDLVVQLEPWEDGRAYDRLGLTTEYCEILNVRVPCVTIPVGPGRNLAVILELAAMNNRQKGMGYNAAQKLADEHDRGIDLGIGF